MWIIGIDGGGTKCEAGLFNPEGELVSKARSGPANVFANFSGAVSAIDLASDQVIDHYNRQQQATSKNKLTKQECFLSLGCAGGSIDSAKKRFHLWEHKYAGAMLTSDIHVSCLAANNAKPCALLVIGTGSCFAVYDNDQVTQYGGHGFLLGDNASGAWLGKHAISWYLQSLETPNNDIELQRVLSPSLGESVNDIIEKYGQATSGDFGALVPQILLAQTTSTTVQNWLHEGAKYAADLIVHHVHKDIPVFLTGGLANVYKPLVENMIKKPIHVPNENAVFGAFYAGQQYLQQR